MDVDDVESSSEVEMPDDDGAEGTGNDKTWTPSQNVGHELSDLEEDDNGKEKPRYIIQYTY